MVAGPPGFAPQPRSNPFARNVSGSPGAAAGSSNNNTASNASSNSGNGLAVRPKSVIFAAPTASLSSSPATPPAPSHSRSFSHASAVGPNSLVRAGSVSRNTYDRSREGTPASGTFAPSFIKTEEMKQRSIDVVRGIEGENDFSGKRYVWLKDPQAAFVKGWVVEELEDSKILVQCEDGSQRTVEAESVDKVNPAKFDKANDMAELTHLNEASVVHNLHMRYQSDLIYTYSGLFLVTVNPYCPLPIYTNEYINMYKGRNRDDTKPHIFAMADEAFRNLVEEGENQSILVTGESGAGKTENTKKVIQYLAAVAHVDPKTSSRLSASQQHATLSAQILRANPILEAFGNAQTVRNNNSSRFGKFIRIEFTPGGCIAGAFIDWYLLEKSRVVRINNQERNYHVFYQLLAGADPELRRELLLDDFGVEDFAYTRGGNDVIAGVSDSDEWESLMEAFAVMGFSPAEQNGILRTVAAVLHLGNISVVKESRAADQARLASDSTEQAERLCHLLGVPVEPFLKGLLHPRVKAGREWVEKVQTPEQVRLSIDALAKGIYERGFGDLVARINEQLDRAGLMGTDDARFIGVLDIAGFEIFEENSFEQLCINYTNEKLQQFFNHHMFVLEQEEYAREQIEWQFIDFGRDLQPTIDLIELSNPIGIFSCLDEDCVMPKATDKSFTEKLHALWDKKSSKYRPSRLQSGFILTHYAAEVEYSTNDWLAKNKDPLNDSVTRLLATSTDPHVARLFADCASTDPAELHHSGTTTSTMSLVTGRSSRVKKGLFRTVAQRHKEQLAQLMAQLHSTHPHFVRCILPNHKKRPKMFDGLLVLDQLRCNGVLEGIRIARTGFPNRLSFAEFRQRYEVLCRDMPKGGHVDGQTAAALILDHLGLDRALFRVGLTKVFFRAGVLAELEEQRDALINEIMSRFQAVARGFSQRRVAFKRLYRAEATRVIQRNFHAYLGLCDNPWWKLFVRMRPLMGATRTATEVRRRDEAIKQLRVEVQQHEASRKKLEEDRRAAMAEISRIQQTLESERALALDKEEIFLRLQDREAELEDKLSGAIDDQERLEDQLDALLATKKRADDDIDKLRAQLEQAASLITRLEEEKTQLARQVAALDAKLADVARQQSQRSEQERVLAEEVKMLQSRLGIQERKARDLETRLLQVDQDAAVQVATAQKEVQAARTREQRLADEHDDVQRQLAQLSQMSTDYEERMRQKESELALARSDNKKYEAERRSLEDQRRALGAESDKATARLREAQAEIEALRAQEEQLRREAVDAKALLEARLSADAQADENRRVLEAQLADLKQSLFAAQKELSRERQSRDDVQLLGEHKLQALQEEYDHLNESKIIIEKEMYAQQDTLRRTVEARKAIEKERDDARQEVRRLRAAKAEAEEARVEAETSGERVALRMAREREESLLRDLDAAQERLQWFEGERARLSGEVDELNKLIVSSGEFGLKNDQAKERMERELHTVKSRLAASENDNRALLNKLQQRGLEIARSTSRASEASRGQIQALSREKTRLEEQNANLHKQLGEAQMAAAGLEKKVEKLHLNLEDMGHEMAREAKTSRNAEKVSSNATAQLAEVNRAVEAERQLRGQAQSTLRTVQATLEARDRELADLRAQMLDVLRIVDPANVAVSTDDSSTKERTPSGKDFFDLVRKIEDLQQDLRVQKAGRSNAEAQVVELRAQQKQTQTPENQAPLRTRLEEMDPNEAPFMHNGTVSPSQLKKVLKAGGNNSNGGWTVSNGHTGTTTKPTTTSDGRPERTGEVLSMSSRMDLKAELEEVQNQLQLAQMQNRHLQSQLERARSNSVSGQATRDLAEEEGSGGHGARMQKLEKANSRLHDLLDDSTKKVSVLEKALRSGELSLHDIQTRSHEEILDLLNGQEESRRSLLHSHKDAVAELTDVKEHYEKLRHERAQLEVDLRDARSELAEMEQVHEQETASRGQLLQEFADLQIRLDAETSKLTDVTSSLTLYKSRADEYYSKLEQAEMAVIKASRAEQFARTQMREAEETYAEVMAERKKMDGMVEDLQRQNQRLEERLEDASTDLEAATQAKKRLQHELEDYRSQRAMDIEDTEASMEQTRKKYQAEFATLTKELDLAREEKLFKQAEIGRLREELDELRSKWDDEVLNSSTWAKEKTRLESTLSDVVASRDEAVQAHTEAQGRIVGLLSQVHTLRTSVDETTAERDALVREKRSVEARLTEAKAGLDELAARGANPSLRSAAHADKEMLELRSSLAQQEDVAAAAVEKMRRAEALAAEVQKDMAAERESSKKLQADKAALEKSLSEVQVKLVDLETKGFSSASQDIKFLNKRIQELETQLETHEQAQSQSQRSVRNVDRAVKDLQGQLERKEKQNQQLQDDVARMRDKADKLLKAIDELQASESSVQLTARRAERELREEREKSLRMERELETWRGMSGSSSNNGDARGSSGASTAGSMRNFRAALMGHTASTATARTMTTMTTVSDATSETGSVDVPKRKSSIGRARAPSMTKGFL